ncbi:DUF3226 domain-containing protein [Alistipes senegalensis]|uniref:DUF3226 domain-containing protein n=1 Tax=Alistipes senegalensis TaxID=1288121 RepID=UPI0018AB2655|nr:DUF3226 domain-containing protein [Alistipes senegalensis]
MEKILFALCEGPHDVAFLYRILRVNGLKKYSKTIGAFPPPLDIYFTKEAAGENLERLKLEEIRNRRLPSEVLSYGDNVLVLLYAIGGDSKVESRKRLLQDIGSMYGRIPMEKEIRTGATAECSVLYFFDADQKGIDARLQEVCKELSEILKQEVSLSGDPQQYRHANGITYAAHIFAEAEKQTGKLEDILLPLMQKNNEVIFKKAEEYVTLHDPQRLPRLKVKWSNEGLMEVRDNSDKGEYHRDKSVIGVAAQLQNSGATNAVCIKHSDYLNRAKIVSNPSCIEIWHAFKALIAP